MATITPNAKLEVTATFIFSEQELRALDALVGYGTDPFLEVFYKHLGRAYMQPHEAGLRSLFNSISQQQGGILRRADDARRVFEGERVAITVEASERFKRLSDEERERLSARAAAEEDGTATANSSGDNDEA